MNIKYLIIATIFFTFLSSAEAAKIPPAGYDHIGNKNSEWEEGTKAEILNYAPLQNHGGPFVRSSFLPKEGNRFYNFYFKRYTSPEELKWIKTVWKRAGYFRDFIEKRLKANDMPHEILYLPIVESAFKPNALSKSGAVGLWQFMTNSISGYNMSINDWLDERKDFWKSTEAAISKLKYNYSELKDWNLAIAAYNCGLGKVSRAVKASGIKNYWTLCAKGYLPDETVRYIPKLLALSDIMTNGGRYGLEETWEKPLTWERIPLKNTVDIRMLAGECGISLDILKNGNAELKYFITPPGKSGYCLKVPADAAEKVNRTIAKKKNKLTDFHIYKIEQGDTLYDLSLYYGISVSMIESFNDVDPKSLRIGSRLIIPVSKKDIKPYSKRTASKWTPTKDPLEYSGEYTVRKGDTLWSIAKLYLTDIYHLAYFNNLKTESILSIGQKLKVPSQEIL